VSVRGRHLGKEIALPKSYPVVALAVILRLGWPGEARAADLDELSKYLAFIEGFQHLFEFCQAEARLPSAQIKYGRDHIGERRALIFAGLSESQRAKISADAVGKKKKMLDGIMEHVAKEQPNKKLMDLCKEGFFEGVMESEQKAEAKETAAIRKAKN
jgi:hypothetical protein